MLTDEELSTIYRKYLGEIQIAATGLTEETYPPLDVLEDIAGLFNEVGRLRAENERLLAATVPFHYPSLEAGLALAKQKAGRKE